MLSQVSNSGWRWYCKNLNRAWRKKYRLAIDAKNNAVQIKIEVEFVEYVELTSIFVKKSGEEVIFFISMINLP